MAKTKHVAIAVFDKVVWFKMKSLAANEYRQD